MSYYRVQTDGTRVLIDSDGKSNALTEILTASQTLTAADSGKTFLIGTDAIVIQLPATALGLEYTFINVGADGNNTVTISPADVDGVFGTIANAAADSVASGSDDDDWQNTKATSNKGDRCKIVADGTSGWYIAEGVGIWASV